MNLYEFTVAFMTFMIAQCSCSFFRENKPKLNGLRSAKRPLWLDMAKASFACTAELVSDPQLERPRFFTRRECARLMGFPDKCLLGNEHSTSAEL